MQYEKFRPFIKWSIYYSMLLVLFALQTTPRFLVISDVKPILVISLMVCVCMFENILPSGIFSVITGLFWDVTSDKILGFNAIIFLCIGTAISLFCVYFLHTKLVNSVIFCTVVVLTQGFLDYFFYYLIWSKENSVLILASSIIPTALYSIIFSLPFFYIVRAISLKFNDVTRV